MINLKAEVKKGHRGCTTALWAVVARIMANIAKAKEQRPSLLAAACRWAEVRCPRVTRSRVGLWRSKPRIGFLMSRKWLPWMVLVTGISHLWDALRASFPEERIWGGEWNPPYRALDVLHRSNAFSETSIRISNPLSRRSVSTKWIAAGEARPEMKNEMIHDNSRSNTGWFHQSLLNDGKNDRAL